MKVGMQWPEKPASASDFIGHWSRSSSIIWSLFWLVLGYFGLLLGCSGSFWVILPHFGSLWIVLVRYGLFWLILAHFG